MKKWLSVALVLTTVATGLHATPLETSTRPPVRPNEAAETVELASAAVRPQVRPSRTVPSVTEPLPVVSNQRFQNWIKGFEKRALVQGISALTLTNAFSGVQYDAEVIQRDRNQSEFTKTIWEYLDSAASDTRIQNGKIALSQNKQALEAIEQKHGVEKEVVVAVWGLESAYGSYRGDKDVIQSLATLAFDGRRGKFFEQQLIAALKILQSGDVPPRKMTGSWAGAMGHTQFIPTSYLAYAVDFTGDGKRDIWSDNPADALASTAAYLQRSGWVKGQPWGVEVNLPKGFNYALAKRSIKKSPAQWANLGVTGIGGGKVPDYGNGSILLPAGGTGAAFLVFKNFAVIERYNAADAYVIGVGHLSDRIMGGKPIQAEWPREDRALSFSERKELQQLLTVKGFNTKGVDGKIGPNTMAAIRSYQTVNGLVADGYPSLSLLESLK
ncbi:MAG: lytic murein transglycosylase [Paracoccaceae bacterium]